MQTAQTIPVTPTQPTSRTLPVSGTSSPTAEPTAAADNVADNRPVTGGKKEKKVKWGPVQKEAVAICRQNHKGHWQCYGPLDNQVIADEPTLQSALKRQRCAGGTWAAGGPLLRDEQFEAYRCGHSLGAGDYDLVKRYNLITAQRSYMCPEYQPSDGRCTTLYDGQDKR